MKKIATTILAGILAFASLAAAQAPSQPKPSAAPKSGAATRSGGTATRATYDRALLRPALLKEKAPEMYQVRFITTRGDFVVSVTRAWAPLGGDRFYNLVKHHFYDNASFFRVLPGFVVQFGLSAYPPVSAAWTNATIKDDPVVKGNAKGYLTFATGGPNTRTTQVFINLADNARLDSLGFAAFGQVIEGINVVEALYGGYGEGAPSGAGPAQDQIEKQGKAYLDQGWPKLDSIKTAILVGVPSAPAKKPVSRPTAPSPVRP